MRHTPRPETSATLRDTAWMTNAACATTPHFTELHPDQAEYLRELRAITAQAGAGELDAPHQKPTIGHRRDDIMRRAQQAIETI